jgi:polar amino acid transport system substrate-binding protein
MLDLDETERGRSPLRWGSFVWVRALLLLVTAIGSAAPASAETRSVTIGASVWPPYVDPQLPGQGLALSIVTAAFERAGYRVEVELAPWLQTLESASAGDTAVVAAVWPTPERERELWLSAPYLENEIRLLKRRKKALEFKSLADLRGLRIGVVYGFSYGPEFDRSTGFVRAPESHVLANLLQLLAGRVDATIGDERSLRYEMERHLRERKDEVGFLPRAVSVQPLCIGVSRRRPGGERLVADFDAALEELRRDGGYRRLVRQANEEIWRNSYLPR